MPKGIDRLIINSPFEQPSHHWSYNRETQTFEKVDGRRPAGFVRATERSKDHDDPGVFIPIELVNRIRTHLERWQNDGRPGLTGISKRLLEHWTSKERERQFFFCQLEAIETLMFLTEAPDSYKTGLDIPSDSGPFQRWCSKMATGSGKTVVMAMLIAWQVINKITYRQDTRFSKSVLIVAPGLTVKSRLAVLLPAHPDSYYQQFDVVPTDLMDKLRQGQLKIINWHTLMPLKEKDRSVVKKGPESDEAFVRRTIEELAQVQNMIVINDEAHHAWRLSPDETETSFKGEEKEAAQEATRWMEGLDRIHNKRGILRCFDLTATPFRPLGKKSNDELLFPWIVSDFSLNDAIESGLVKTPRVVVRDDATLDTKTLKSKFYHIYRQDHVSDDLNRKAEPTEPLHDLVRNAYYLLGKDWLETQKNWQKEGHAIPPVMITVCNRTETAERIKHAFIKGDISIPEMQEPETLLRIDSDVLREAEEKESADTDEYNAKKKKPYREYLENIVENVDSLSEEQKEKYLKLKDEELLREIVDSVGIPRTAGEQIRHVIAVAMLSEGWDTKTVTHIMGLRAFSSQLLCEQVIGRGLRRVSYDVNEETGMYEPEYVNIFGVPFSFLPHESQDGPPPPPPQPRTRIEVVPGREKLEITWPNVVRIEHVLRSTLDVDINKIESLVIDSSQYATIAELSDVIENKSINNFTVVDLQDMAERFRLQTIIFKAASGIADTLLTEWKGAKEDLVRQLVTIVTKFIESNRVSCSALVDEEPLRKRILYMLNINKIVQHITSAIRFDEAARESLELVFESSHPIRSTANMPTWYTSKPTEPVDKSQISHVVIDSSWELSESYELERNKAVDSWVKNDHLGFEISYIWGGQVRKYRPDFLIHLSNGDMLIMEVKGQDNAQNKTKRQYMTEWVEAVNQDGRFGKWHFDTSFKVNDVKDILAKYTK